LNFAKSVILINVLGGVIALKEDHMRVNFHLAYLKAKVAKTYPAAFRKSNKKGVAALIILLAHFSI
jgi:hypothetical protein